MERSSGSVGDAVSKYILSTALATILLCGANPLGNFWQRANYEEPCYKIILNLD